MVKNFPSIVCTTGRRFQWIKVQRYQPYLVSQTVAQSQIYTAVQIEFNVKILGVSRYGTEEELQATVLERFSSRSRFLCANMLLACPQMGLYRVFIVAELCI